MPFSNTCFHVVTSVVEKGNTGSTRTLIGVQDAREQGGGVRGDPGVRDT
jgi:hypothetical protein